MELLLSLLVGILFGVAFFLLLERGMMRLILAVVLLGNAANLFVFIGGGVSSNRPPIIEENLKQIEGQIANPVPQALILTAIVIGFGVIAFFLVLSQVFYKQEQQQEFGFWSLSKKKEGGGDE